jgi:hypothetical protein
MEAVIVSANVDADVRSRGAFLHFDNLAFELVASAEFHGSLLSLSAGDNPGSARVFCPCRRQNNRRSRSPAFKR